VTLASLIEAAAELMRIEKRVTRAVDRLKAAEAEVIALRKENALLVGRVARLELVMGVGSKQVEAGG
jgi:hypothetical protein